MSKTVRLVIGLCATALLALAEPTFGIPCEVFLIPEETHSGSGYTALECGRDGKVYVGTAWYGGSAHLVRFDPDNAQWDKIFDAHAVTRERRTALGAQGKFHAKILVDGDGVIWAATKHGNEAWEQRSEFGEDATGYPGGHLFSYDPKTGQVVDHGILMKQNGMISGSIDVERRRLYYISDPKGHLLVYDIDRNTVRDLGYTGFIPRYTAIDKQGRVFTHGGGTTEVNYGWIPTGAKTPYLCMYDPATDKLYQLAVTTEGPGADEYAWPYVLVASADGKRLFGAAIGGKYVFDFDLDSISLDGDNPMANGSIVCHLDAEVTPPGNQRAGVVGQDGCFYIANGRLLFRYDPARRTVENLGEIETEFGPNIYPQGACVGSDGTLYLKHLFPYRIMRFPQLTAPKGVQ